jgi:hypothetical protein
LCHDGAAVLGELWCGDQPTNSFTYFFIFPKVKTALRGRILADVEHIKKSITPK